MHGRVLAGAAVLVLAPAAARARVVAAYLLDIAPVGRRHLARLGAAVRGEIRVYLLQPGDHRRDHLLAPLRVDDARASS